MTPEQARAVAEAMAGMWEVEHPATVAVLEAVPDEGRDHRPHPKSRSGWELATHLATADLWFLDSIARGAFEWDEEAVKQRQAEFGSAAEVAAFYRSALPAKLAEVRALPDASLAEDLDFFGMMQFPRAQWIGFAGNHSVHHRGQLSAYLRPMGGRVPDIYGPSGDTESAPAS